jgi:hypothetical protein
MPEIQLDIQDATGNKKQSVQVPHDAPADRLIAVLIQRMNFPTHGPDGQLLSSSTNAPAANCSTTKRSSPPASWMATRSACSRKSPPALRNAVKKSFA